VEPDHPNSRWIPGRGLCFRPLYFGIRRRKGQIRPSNQNGQLPHALSDFRATVDILVFPLANVGVTALVEKVGETGLGEAHPSAQLDNLPRDLTGVPIV